MENLVVIGSIAICVLAGFFAWWMERGNKSDSKDIDEKDEK